MNDFKIKGFMKSQNCEVDLQFTVQPEYTKIVIPFLFAFLQIFFFLMNLQPFKKFFLEENYTVIVLLGEKTLLGNFLIDILTLMINMKFFMTLIKQY